jgi:Pvc16 N-terminal domain
MISHALTVVINEFNKHLTDDYQSTETLAKLGNLADGFTGEAMPRNNIFFSVVNIKEEKSLKNLPNYVRNDVTLKALYENPPVFLNFQILVTAPHETYSLGLSLLSRVIRFFQYKNVFTQDNVSPDSITKSQPTNSLDQLEEFKLIFDLYSAPMEEVNHLWGTLGGKQYPFVIYWLRMLDLKFKAVPEESSLITEVVTDFRQKTSTSN